MSLTQSFSTSQTLGQETKITLTDTSTGTDVTVVSRRVILTDNKGLYYNEDNLFGTTTAVYSTWSDFPTTTTVTLTVLNRDRTFNVRVNWVDIDGNTVVTYLLLREFTLYAKQCYFNLIKAQTAVEKLRENANYYQKLIKLLVSIKEAEDSVDSLIDISSSQAALNRAKQVVDNPSYFY